MTDFLTQATSIAGFVLVVFRSDFVGAAVPTSQGIAQTASTVQNVAATAVSVANAAASTGLDIKAAWSSPENCLHSK